MATPRLGRLVTSPSRPPTRDRSFNCTHMQLTRLYDEHGYERCSICHRTPQLGWLYRCTQDYDGQLPASDFFDVQDSKAIDHDAQLYTLSASIIEAAAKGHYTDRQLEIIWKQKIEVRRTIQQVRPNTSSTVSTANSSQYSLPASTTNSTIPSSNDDTEETEHSHLSDYSQSCRGTLEPIQEVHDDLECDRRMLPFVKPSVPPPCTFRVCHACRPIYRERAWLSIDAALKGLQKQPSKHEMHNKRIADLNVVKQLGLNTCYSRVHEHQLYEENNPSKRNSRTQFQDIVHLLLRNPGSPQVVNNLAVDECGYELKRVPATESLYEANSADSSSDESPSVTMNQTSLSRPQPIYHRRGFEKLTSIKVLKSSAISVNEDDDSSSGMSTGRTSASCPAIIGLKIDIDKANEDYENVPPPKKTPPDSIKDSLCRFSGMKRPLARFVID